MRDHVQTEAGNFKGGKCLHRNVLDALEQRICRPTRERRGNVEISKCICYEESHPHHRFRGQAMQHLPKFIATLFLVCLHQPLVAAERIVLVAGGGERGNGSPAVEAALASPFGVDFDRAGNMFLVEMTGQRVRKIDQSGLLTTVAGDGTKGSAGDGGPAASAQFNGMHNLTIGPDDTIYVADTWNNCVRAIDPGTGKIARVAGTGEKGFSGDGGPATEAKLGGVYCATLNQNGDKLYLADLDNRRVRRVDLSSGIITTVAGNGQRGVPGDGAVATEAPLVDPRAVAVDQASNIYVLERSGHALRVVDPRGKIWTRVGTGKAGATGDDGNARLATLNGPKHLCFDQKGNVIIADTENHLIRKYLVGENKVIRLVGSGRRGQAGIGGPPLQVELNQPHGVYVHKDGTLYISDSSNNRILKIVEE
jgi:sugar lactone lactonase YvrE